MPERLLNVLDFFLDTYNAPHNVPNEFFDL